MDETARPSPLLEAGALFFVGRLGVSNRQKSGVGMRFPRIARLRMDERPIEADRLETLMGEVRDADSCNEPQ